MTKLKGWGDFSNLVQQISYPGFKFVVVEEAEAQPIAGHDWKPAVRHYVQVICEGGTDNHTGQPFAWKGRKWRLSPHMTDMEVVQTVFLAVSIAEEHERRERFQFHGVAILSPHQDVWALLAFHKQRNSKEVRAHGPSPS